MSPAMSRVVMAVSFWLFFNLLESAPIIVPTSSISLTLPPITAGSNPNDEVILKGQGKAFTCGCITTDAGWVVINRFWSAFGSLTQYVPHRTLLNLPLRIPLCHCKFRWKPSDMLRSGRLSRQHRILRRSRWRCCQNRHFRTWRWILATPLKKAISWHRK